MLPLWALLPQTLQLEAMICSISKSKLSEKRTKTSTTLAQTFILNSNCMTKYFTGRHTRAMQIKWGLNCMVQVISHGHKVFKEWSWKFQVFGFAGLIARNIPVIENSSVLMQECIIQLHFQLPLSVQVPSTRATGPPHVHRRCLHEAQKFSKGFKLSPTIMVLQRQICMASQGIVSLEEAVSPGGARLTAIHARIAVVPPDGATCRRGGQKSSISGPMSTGSLNAQKSLYPPLLIWWPFWLTFEKFSHQLPTLLLWRYYLT